MTHTSLHNHLESIRSRHATLVQTSDLLGLRPGVTLALARDLNRLVGGHRKRQGHLSNRHSRDVFDLLAMHGRAIYARRSSELLNCVGPPGVMPRDTFNYLSGDDALVVVEPDSEAGGLLLSGTADLAVVEIPFDLADQERTVVARIGNAADVDAVFAWAVRSTW